MNLIKDSLSSIEWTHIENLKTSLISLADLMGASIVPAWKTQSEVENVDDIGVLISWDKNKPRVVGKVTEILR